MEKPETGRDRTNCESIPQVWNRPVDPTSDVDSGRQCQNPVTLDDLEGGFMTSGLREFQVKDGRIDMERLRTDLDQWHHPSLSPGESSADLASHHFGRALWLRITFMAAENWKEAVDELARRNLCVFDCWGNVPGLKERVRDGMAWGAWSIPDEVQKEMTDRLGRQFFGWDNGENDGRWFWQSLRIYPSPVNRKMVFEYFDAWFLSFLSDMQNYSNALCGLTYPHYFAKMAGHRMIGAEFLQALPSVPMWAAWVRGAARQYQMLWMGGISLFDMFGYKTFEEDKFAGNSVEAGIGNPSGQTGPDRGHSLSVLRRTWYLLFMYGVNIESFELALFVEGHHLSAVGKLQLEGTRFGMANKERRGVQYCPVALLLDFHSSWVPPRHFYSDSFYTVGGGIPYEKGDHQIDLFFRQIYSGYQDCAYYQDGRGFLTPTTHGDIVDVLLSDVSGRVLNRYQVAFVAGETVMQGEILEKLKEYATAGGSVMWSLSQLESDARALAGIISVGGEMRATRTCDPQERREYQEESFAFPSVNVSDADVLLDDGDRHPLVVRKAVGKGEIITMIPSFGLTDRIAETHPLVGADPEKDISTIYFYNKALGSPYRILNGIKATVFTRLTSLNLVEVMASLDPIAGDCEPSRRVSLQYVTNVTGSPDRLVITLLNNESSYAYAKVRVKNARILGAVDLLHPEKNMPVKEGCLALTFFPAESVEYNLFIIELKLDRPVVAFLKAEA